MPRLRYCSCARPCALLPTNKFHHLNEQFLTDVDRLRRARTARTHVWFAIQQIEKPLDRGGETIFERPVEDDAWRWPELQTLASRMLIAEGDKRFRILVSRRCRLPLLWIALTMLLTKSLRGSLQAEPKHVVCTSPVSLQGTRPAGGD